MQKITSTMLIGFFISTPFSALAVEAATTSATGSLFKMLIGLAVVLLVLALISWLMKKFMPVGANQTSVIRVIGGTSVGSREKVVVLEVANRWLVVGVAAGQVTSLANLEPSFDHIKAAQNSESSNLNSVASHGFAKWLKASSAKFSEFKDQKDV